MGEECNTCIQDKIKSFEEKLDQYYLDAICEKIDKNEGDIEFLKIL